MNGPPRRSIRAGIRAGFALVVLTTVVVAAVVTVVLVRRANETATIEDTTATARSNAATVRTQVVSVMEADGSAPVSNVLTLVEVLERAFRRQRSEIVRLSGAELVAVRPGGTAPTGRLPATGVSVDRLAASALARGREVVWTADSAVLVATPVPFSDEEARALSLGDDVVAVVAAAPLGTAGLGPAGPALLIAALAALVAAALLSEAVSRRILRPLAAVVSTTRRLSRGDLSARVDPSDVRDAEFSEVAATVNEMAERLDAGREDRKRFLLDMSHEVRTPLTSISGYAEMIEEGTITQPEEIVSSARTIRAEVGRIDRLVDDLVAQARLDRGEVTFANEPVDLVEVTHRVVDSVGARHRPLEVEVTADENEVWVIADPDRVHQILTNLTDNALDFAESRVQLRVGGSDTHGTVTVIDDGPGLGDDPARLFERHVAGSERRDRSSHLGVGLSIVATLCQAMGGSVEALSTPRGARFLVRLPRLQPVRGTPQAATPT